MTVDGALPLGTTAKDMVMAVIRQIGAAGAHGHALEFAGQAVRALGIEGRMTLCNMAVECGARVALIAPDEMVLAYIAGQARAPGAAMLARAWRAWSELHSDPDARFDREVSRDAAAIAPMVTWGTSPDQALPITGAVPDPAALPGSAQADAARALAYGPRHRHRPCLPGARYRDRASCPSRAGRRQPDR